MHPLYLDYNSTHPPDAEVIQEALSEYLEAYANPSGRSRFSQLADEKLEFCRNQIARDMGVLPEQIIFTGTATEAAALAIHSLTRFYQKKVKTIQVAMSPFEHPAVSENISSADPIEFVCLPPDHIEMLSQLKRINPVLITMNACHNETGISPPPSFFRKLYTDFPDIPVLVDASQLIRRATSPFIQEQEVMDYEGPLLPAILSHPKTALFFSGHKIGAGPGCAVLILPQDESLRHVFSRFKLIAGGSQEREVRPGTQNLLAILAIAKRIKKIRNRKLNLAATTIEFEKKIMRQLNLTILGYQKTRLPGTTLLFLPKADIDFLLMGLDMKGITVSTGTSCKSKSRTPSPALLAMGFSESEAIQVIRLSYDDSFLPEQHDYFIRTLVELA